MDQHRPRPFIAAKVQALDAILAGERHVGVKRRPARGHVEVWRTRIGVTGAWTPLGALKLA